MKILNETVVLSTDFYIGLFAAVVALFFWHQSLSYRNTANRIFRTLTLTALLTSMVFITRPQLTHDIVAVVHDKTLLDNYTVLSKTSRNTYMLTYNSYPTWLYVPNNKDGTFEIVKMISKKGTIVKKGDKMNEFIYDEQSTATWFWEEVMRGNVRICDSDDCAVYGVIKTASGTVPFASGDTIKKNGDGIAVIKKRRV